MCGIGGIITHREVDVGHSEAVALAMTSTQRHRGPDELGVWSAPGAALAAARLAITGEGQHGQQPVLDRYGGVLVFNGEIYNYRTLNDGSVAADASDTEVLAGLLACGDPSLLSTLNGPFALARYEPATGRLLLARDRVGKKPLYLAQASTGWAFSSTVAGLHVATGPLRIRSEAIHEYLVFRSVGGHHSAFAGIEQVPPGTWLELDADRILRRGCYWRSPRPVGEMVPPGRVRAVIDSAVAARADGARELGVFLSGGLDSAVVAASLRRQLPDQPLRLVSAGYNVPGKEDERPFALRLGTALSARHDQVIVSGERDVPGLVADAVRLLEDPVQDPVIVPTLALARAAAQFTRVVLTGDGSDELWGGYQRFSAPPAELVDYLPRTAIFRPEELGLVDWPSTYLDDIEIPATWMDPLDRILRLEVANRLRNYHLSRIDKLIMGCGVEARCPYLDPAVIGTALSLPARLKCPAGKPKALLTEAYRSDLPNWLAARKKQPFSVPIRRWLTGELAQFVRDLLIAANTFTGAIVDVRPLFVQLEGPLEMAETAAARLWALLLLEVWHREVARPLGRPPVLGSDTWLWTIVGYVSRVALAT